MQPITAWLGKHPSGSLLPDDAKALRDKPYGATVCVNEVANLDGMGYDEPRVLLTGQLDSLSRAWHHVWLDEEIQAMLGDLRVEQITISFLFF